MSTSLISGCAGRKVSWLCMLALFGLASACDAAPKKTGAVDGSPASATLTSATAKSTGAPAKPMSGTFEVACGCSIEDVGHCSEHARIEGSFVPLTVPESLGMGHMPFCGKHGQKAEIAGAIVDGTFVASSFSYVASPEPPASEKTGQPE